MSLLSEIKTAVTGCGLSVETGVFSDEPPDELRLPAPPTVMLVVLPQSLTPMQLIR